MANATTTAERLSGATTTAEQSSGATATRVSPNVRRLLREHDLDAGDEPPHRDHER